ncbi:hypothetical protein WJX84_003774 [Apatococcus fuscideae]|uniref:Fungal lipase-type domain-containing protein n=1 Tax=Apatococcus fuscideae TaxID=2026836 RepID=A0AAW1TE83_9CHLO
MRFKPGMWAARAAFSAVESLSYISSSQGLKHFVLVQNAAIVYTIGPSRAVSLSLKCLLACCGARAVQIFLFTKKLGGDGENMDSIWDLEPPADTGDPGMGASWKVLRELARSLNRGKDEMPSLEHLQTLEPPDLVLRLIYLFHVYQRQPVEEELSEGESLPDSLAEELAQYLYFSDRAYDEPTDAKLQEKMEKRGWQLNLAKMQATWGEHEPAYFVATHDKNKELLCVIRGTAQMEDLVTDLVAHPVPFDGDESRQVHSGIYAAASWVAARFTALAQGMAAAGYTITITGHSLGAGAAAMIGLLLKRRGVKNVKVYGFATPACMDSRLAEESREFTHSVVFRDDIVPRFSPEALLNLNDEINDFRPEEEVDDAELDQPLRTIVALVRKVAEWSSGGDDDGDKKKPPSKEEREEARKHLQKYNPQIPGKVVYTYRKKSVRPEGKEDSDELVRTIITGDHKALRDVRLCESMINDHGTEAYFRALGQDNPAHAEKEEEERQQKDCEEKKKEKAEQGAKQEEIEHACDEGDDEDDNEGPDGQGADKESDGSQGGSQHAEPHENSSDGKSMSDENGGSNDSWLQVP